MRFYRLATKEDFEGRFKVPTDHFNDYLPSEVERLIEDGKIRDAIVKLRKIKGLSIFECKGLCHKYESFIKAKKDFLSGKPVFTDY